jgi:hypothetical protein
LENLKYRSNQYHNDEVIRYNERYEERVKTTDRTVPKERVRDEFFCISIIIKSLSSYHSRTLEKRLSKYVPPETNDG